MPKTKFQNGKITLRYLSLFHFSIYFSILYGATFGKQNTNENKLIMPFYGLLENIYNDFTYDVFIIKDFI